MSPLDVLLWAGVALVVVIVIAIGALVVFSIRFAAVSKRIAEKIEDDQDWTRTQRRGPRSDR